MNDKDPKPTTSRAPAGHSGDTLTIVTDGLGAGFIDIPLAVGDSAIRGKRARPESLGFAPVVLTVDEFLRYD